MAVRESVVHKNHNPTMFIYRVISTYFFRNGCLSWPYLGSTKGIEIKLGTYIAVNERKCRRQEP